MSAGTDATAHSDARPTDTNISPTEHVRALVAASGSSFFWAMRFLPKPKRDAMFAVYAFCREVDDIADADAPLDTKRAELGAWRIEIDRLFAGQPERPVARALAERVVAGSTTLDRTHSKRSAPVSSNASIRSRAVRRPSRCWRATPFSPPPWRICSASST